MSGFTVTKGSKTNKLLYRVINAMTFYFGRQGKMCLPMCPRYRGINAETFAIDHISQQQVEILCEEYQ